MKTGGRMTKSHNAPAERTPSPRKFAVASTGNSHSNHHWADLGGILLIALGILIGIALAVPNSGVLGQLLSEVLLDFCGKAAWVFCPGVIALGVFMILGAKPVGIKRFAWGLGLFIVTFCATEARHVGGDYFDPQAIGLGGGIVGACVGWALDASLGAAKSVGLGALYAAAVVLMVDFPIRSALQIFRRVPIPGRGSALTGAVPQPAMKAEELKKAELAEATTRTATVFPETPPVQKQLKLRWNEGEKEQPSPTLATDVSIPKEGYRLPPLALLAEPAPRSARSQIEMQKNIETLEGTLEQFGIDANVVEVAAGPTVTRYEVQLGPGIKVARITSLADNIAMDLAASQVRVEAPIPGKAAIGVEVPNAVPTPVFLRELADRPEFVNSPSRLTIALGKDVSGEAKYGDLGKMPHLLIGGATNSGKSIGLSTIITSLLMRNTPKDLRLVMIDPKRVELTLFDKIPHLLCPVIKDVKEAPGVLRAVWREMDRRYDQFSEAGVRNIDGWNAKASFNERMSYIVVIIDELADLMIQAAAEVETSICRLAQLARATGIHLVIATQRPSVDVITGTIKANIASRIAFTVSSQIDSRTILDVKGAESLIGRGDMLYSPIGSAKPTRIQGCYISEKEIEAICSFWRDQESPQYTLEPIEAPTATKGGSGGAGEDDVDPLWEEAVRWVAERGQASTSMLQRKFSIGFQRASRLLDSMEERGIVGPRDGPRPREVLLTASEVDMYFNGEDPPAPIDWAEDV